MQQPALPRTGRALREETLGIAYHQTTFLTDVGNEPHRDAVYAKWLEAIGIQNRTSLRHLRIDDENDVGSALRALTEILERA